MISDEQSKRITDAATAKGREIVHAAMGIVGLGDEDGVSSLDGELTLIAGLALAYAHGAFMKGAVPLIESQLQGDKEAIAQAFEVFSERGELAISLGAIA